MIAVVTIYSITDDDEQKIIINNPPETDQEVIEFIESIEDLDVDLTLYTVYIIRQEKY